MPDARMPYRVTPVSLSVIRTDDGSGVVSNKTPSAPRPEPHAPPTTPPSNTGAKTDVVLEYVPDRSVLMPDKTPKPVHTLHASRTTPKAWNNAPKPQESIDASAQSVTRTVPGAVAWGAMQNNVAPTQQPTETTPRESQNYDVSLLHRVLSGMGATPPNDSEFTSKKTRLPPDIDPPDMWEATMQRPIPSVPVTPIPTTVPPHLDGSPEVKAAEVLSIPATPSESGAPHTSTHDILNNVNAQLATHTVPSTVGEPLHELVPATKVPPETFGSGSPERNDTIQTPGTAQPASVPASGSSLEFLRARVLRENTQHGTTTPHPSSESLPAGVSQVAHTGPYTPRTTTFTRLTIPNTNSVDILSQTPPDVAVRESKPSTPPRPAPKTPLSSVHTFKRDVEDTITRNRVSVVDVIAAEEKMRTADILSNTGQTVQRRASMSPGMYALIGASITLFVGAAGLLFWYSIARNNVEQAERGNGYFMTEHTTTYNIAKRSRSAIMRGLTSVRSSLAVGLGSITDVQIVKNDTDTREDAPGQRVTGSEFLASLNAGISDRFTRALGSTMLLGIHESAANQPFLLLEVTYYENAFAGMLAWETSMERDLAPLFSSTAAHDATTPVPQQDARTEDVSLATETTTSSTSPTVVIPVHTDPTSKTSTPGTIAGTFGDALLDNSPARVLRDRYGRIRFVWTMPNTKTILITNNEYTVREVKQRLAGRQF